MHPMEPSGVDPKRLAATDSQGEAPAGKATGRRVLFAFSTGDRAIFFPSQDLEKIVGADSKWIDVSKLSAEEWERFLFGFRPEILVTAWSTPPIPEKFSRSSDLSLRGRRVGLHGFGAGFAVLSHPKCLAVPPYWRADIRCTSLVRRICRRQRAPVPSRRESAKLGDSGSL